jgi:hypothetical protein
MRNLADPNFSHNQKLHLARSLCILMNFSQESIPEKYQYSHLSNKPDVTLTDFGKYHPAQNKNPPFTFIDLITKLSLFLQNLMTIFLTVILSYKSLF